MLAAAIRASQGFSARARLLMPRSVQSYVVGVCRPTELPSPVRKMLATRSPRLEQYQELSRTWHRIGSAMVPDYGPYVRHLVRTRVVANGAALDLACGTGITTRALAREFRRVYALDLSAHMIEAARAELGALDNVEFVRADFRAFALEAPVDLVVSSGDSLNYAQSVDELVAAFECVRRALRPGALFAFDLQSEASCSRAKGLVCRCRIPESGIEFYQSWSYDPRTRMSDSCLVTASGVEVHVRRCFPPEEVHAAASAAGLRPLRVFENAVLKRLAGRIGRDFFVLQRDG